jgi:cytochrome c6
MNVINEKENTIMVRIFTLIVGAALFCFVLSGVAISDSDTNISGKAEFNEHCAMCHPDGGNVINSAKTLMGKDREANGIKKPEDIVKLIRNPGPGMTQFDKTTVSDKEAKAIAKYIIKVFK